MAKRTESDEYYVLDLCDEVLGRQSSRQHRFEWLRGDFSARTQRHSYLPVDGYWPDLALVVEFAERQHTESLAIFDRRPTVSGVNRGEQRRTYDERRVALVPQHGLTLVVIPAAAFDLARGKLRRHPELDLERVRGMLKAAGFVGS